MEGFGEDEIESILWIGREVYGTHFRDIACIVSNPSDSI